MSIGSVITTAASAVAVVISLTTGAINYGKLNDKVDTLQRRADVNSSQVAIHTTQLTALDVKAAVQDTKLDAIKETVDKIDHKLDQRR